MRRNAYLANVVFLYIKDLSEHGIAPRQISATTDYGRKRKPDSVSYAGIIPGIAPLQDLIVPAR